MKLAETASNTRTPRPQLRASKSLPALPSAPSHVPSPPLTRRVPLKSYKTVFSMAFAFGASAFGSAGGATSAQIQAGPDLEEIQTEVMNSFSINWRMY